MKKKPEDIYELNKLLYEKIAILSKKLERYKLVAMIDNNDFDSITPEDTYQLVEGILNSVSRDVDIELYAKEV